jgi:hypothetical protein
MKTRPTALLAALLLVCTLAPANAAPQETPQLPFTLVANAFAQGGAISGTSRVTLLVTRWSTEEEGNNLEQILLNEGPKAMTEALRKMDEVGRARVGQELSYGLRFAEYNDLGDGKWRVFLATDRDIDPFESYYNTRSVDYDLTLIELVYDENENTGQGVVAAGVSVKLDEANNRLVIENFDIAPVQLRNVRLSR